MQNLIEKYNDFPFSELKIINMTMWSGWKYKNGVLNSDDKNWINSIITDKYRPDQKTIFNKFIIRPFRKKKRKYDKKIYIIDYIPTRSLTWVYK